jgi:hypothetical protein
VITCLWWCCCSLVCAFRALFDIFLYEGSDSCSSSVLPLQIQYYYFLLLYFSRRFFIYFPPPVHVYNRALGPQMNTSIIYNTVQQQLRTSCHHLLHPLLALSLKAQFIYQIPQSLHNSSIEHINNITSLIPDPPLRPSTQSHLPVADQLSQLSLPTNS